MRRVTVGARAQYSVGIVPTSHAILRNMKDPSVTTQSPRQAPHAALITNSNGTQADPDTRKIVKGAPLTTDQARQMQRKSVEARREAKRQAAIQALGAKDVESALLKIAERWADLMDLDTSVAAKALFALDDAIMQDADRDRVSPNEIHQHLHVSRESLADLLHEYETAMRSPARVVNES